MKILEEQLMREIWGDNPEALFSSCSLFNFGMLGIFNLKEKVAEIDSDAAERITHFMTLGLSLILNSNPYDLREVCKATGLILDYAFENSFVDYGRELEAYLMNVGQLKEIANLKYLTANKDKGFKWENLPEFYA